MTLTLAAREGKMYAIVACRYCRMTSSTRVLPTPDVQNVGRGTEVCRSRFALLSILTLPSPSSPRICMFCVSADLGPHADRIVSDNGNITNRRGCVVEVRVVVT